MLQEARENVCIMNNTETVADAIVFSGHRDIN